MRAFFWGHTHQLYLAADTWPVSEGVSLALVGSTIAEEISTLASRVVRDVSYQKSGPHQLDVLSPNSSEWQGKRPAVLWLHGLGGDKSSGQMWSLCKTLAAAGYVSASANFGDESDLFVATASHCKTAVRFLRSRASDYGIDSDRVAIGGYSYGCYLAFLVSFTEGDPCFDPWASTDGIGGLSVRSWIFTARPRC
ncbi:MAG TPA: hypothetical protein PLN52_21195 [Opitutaceae bacterium]|nr:hypothetical protein [Opitutaceae bacterium]